MKKFLHRLNAGLLISLITASLILVPNKLTYGMSISNKSITVGTSVPSATTSHRLTYTVPSNASVGSVEYEYCTNSPFSGQSCTAPNGIDVTGAVISSQSGITGFSVHANTTSNRVVLTRAVSVVGPVAVNHLLTSIVNPSDVETTIYVRISTFASADGTGAFIDDGGVVWSTSGGLGATGFVPPYLTFCAGITVALNCSSASGSLIDIGVLSVNTTKSATTQFAAATNDPDGYNVFTLGTTMTSGINIINSSAAAQPNSMGNSQFGINLRDNSSPDIGTNIAGIGTGNANAAYNIPDQYAYSNGAAIAGSTLSTEFNRYTVSYIINVNGSQPPGRYSTTITYMAIATF